MSYGPPGGGQPYSGQYGEQNQGSTGGLTQAFGQMGIDGGPAPSARRKKDRHAYHQIEQPAGSVQSLNDGAAGQSFNGASGHATYQGGMRTAGEQHWHQTSQPWQSQRLPQASSQLAPSAPAGTPISMGPGGPQQGLSANGLQNKVNPEQIPSVPVSRDVAAQHYKSQIYPTLVHRLPPPAAIPFVAFDQGSASPKHARLTMNCIPHSHEQLATTQLPLGLVLQPLARQTEGEAPIPILDFGDVGPPRCRRCRAYVNPFMVFTNGGNNMTCNLCGHPNEVSPEYFAPTDPSGIRVDKQDRLELSVGSCEFLVPKEYWSTPPVALRYVFLIDVSAENSALGFLKSVCDGILAALYGEDLDLDDEADGQDEAPAEKLSTIAAGAKVAFLTYDRDVHFYNVSAGLSAPQQLVVSDLEEPFAPISPSTLFVDAIQCKSNIVQLLRSVPDMFGKIRNAEPALLPSLRAALEALSETGGKILCSLGNLSSHGPGRLTPREKNIHTANDSPEQEKILLRTENQSYKKLQADMIKAGVGIDFFLHAPAGRYLDVTTVGLVAEKTGGETFYYSNWAYPRDKLKLEKEIIHAVQRTQGYAALVKVRCSNGLQIAHYTGNFTQHTFGADLEMGTISEDSAIAVTFSYDGKLDTKNDAYFQSALLYTSADGQRRVRCTNVVATVTETARESMRFVDQDAVLAILAKESVARVPEKSLHDVRQAIQDKVTGILAGYRKHHAGSHPPGQLVMPENLKEFAMYSLGLLKSRALKAGKEPSDRRIHELRTVKGMGPAELSLYLYPRMIALHNLEPGEGFADENGHLSMPGAVRASFANIEDGGAYLVDNGQILLLWLHQRVSPNLLEDLFGAGINDLQKLDPNTNTLPVLDTHLNAQTRNILLALEQGAGSGRGSKGLAIQLARQGVDGSEFEFARLLYEDRNGEASSYVDWLVLLHRGVSTEVSASR